MNAAALLLGLVLASIEVPAGLQRFVEKGATPIAVEKGDLNRDGRSDYILVVEHAGKEDAPRSLLVIVGNADGSLKLARRSEKAVYCRECGGVFGDPFNGIEIRKDRFVVHHYGGSSWRWTNDATFAWSRRDRTWQLVRVETSSFHAGDPENEERKTHTSPRDFGKIDLAEFDPDDYLGKGPK
jgi:hypothetical protein